MSWIYWVNYNRQRNYQKRPMGKVLKEEGEIKLITKRTNGFGGRYKDYYFISNRGRETYLTTWYPPEDGHVTNRTVFLEVEDDERAKALLIENINEDIQKLEYRVVGLRGLIRGIEEYPAEEEA